MILQRVLTRIAVGIVATAVVASLFAIDHWTEQSISRFLGASALALIPLTLAVAFVALVYLAWRYSPNAHQDEQASLDGPRTRWIDEPVDLDEVDEYDRRSFVDQLMEIVASASTERFSSVIGLSGPWGSGKTSVLRTLVRRLSEKDLEGAPLVATVNPWRYSTTEGLVVGTFAEIRSALPPEARWSDARNRLADLLEATEPLGALTAPLGFDASRFFRLSANRARRADAASEAHRLAENALLKLRRPILVVLDDIDRLGPDELLALFRAIRLLGRLPYVHYLLTCDLDVVADVLTRTGLVGKDPLSAHRYLEKMIQLRLDLPSIRRIDVDRIVDQAVEQTLTAAGEKLDVEREQEFAFIYNTQIVATLDSPRTIHRWVSHFAYAYRLLAKDVDFVDFVLLTWLRLAYPGITNLLRRRKYALFRGFDIASSLAQVDQNERNSEWHSWLLTAGVPADEVERVYAVLSRMFPEVAKSQARSSGSADLGGALKRKGIGHPDYFERYFALAVPREEISEVDFIDQIELATGGAADTESMLAHALRTKVGSVVDRVENWADNHPDRRLAIIRWLALNYPAANHDDILSPQEAIRGLLYRLATKHGEIDEVLSVVLEGPDGLATAALLMRDLLRNNSEEMALEAATTRVVALIRQDLDRHATLPRNVGSKLRSLLWLWQALDNESVRVWLRQRVESGWPLVDSTAILIGTARPLGVPDPRISLSELDDSTLEALFGLEWLKARAREASASGELDGETTLLRNSHSLDDTWSNRMAVARGILQRLAKPEKQ